MIDPEKLIATCVGVLSSVTGIGNVTDYRRVIRTEEGARAAWYHESQGRIHAWSVTLADNAPLSSARLPGFSRTQSGPIGSDFGIVIEGTFGIDDANASEKAFRALCWLVALKFNKIALVGDGTVVGGLAIGDVYHQEALQWDRFGYLRLADMYVVHYAKFSGRFTGQVDPGPV